MGIRKLLRSSLFWIRHRKDLRLEKTFRRIDLGVGRDARFRVYREVTEYPDRRFTGSWVVYFDAVLSDGDRYYHSDTVSPEFLANKESMELETKCAAMALSRADKQIQGGGDG